MILQSFRHCLNQLQELLVQINATHYSMPCSELSNASIGAHIRHIIELFQCLLDGYDSGLVDYDKRARNSALESNREFAFAQIERLLCTIDKPNKELFLAQSGDGETINLTSNYYRELAYNLEHCIHHQALIKIGLLLNFNYPIDENFGVAFSTIEYRKQNK